jgi:hypothetical protein
VAGGSDVVASVVTAVVSGIFSLTTGMATFAVGDVTVQKGW